MNPWSMVGDKMVGDEMNEGGLLVFVAFIGYSNDNNFKL